MDAIFFQAVAKFNVAKKSFGVLTFFSGRSGAEGFGLRIVIELGFGWHGRSKGRY